MADGALEVGDVHFDGVVAELVVDHGVELVLLGLLRGVRAQLVDVLEVRAAVEAGEAAGGLVSERTGVGVLQYGGKVDPVLNALWGRAIVRFLFLFLALLGRVAVRSLGRLGFSLGFLGARRRRLGLAFLGFRPLFHLLFYGNFVFFCEVLIGEVVGIYRIVHRFNFDRIFNISSLESPLELLFCMQHLLLEVDSVPQLRDAHLTDAIVHVFRSLYFDIKTISQHVCINLFLSHPMILRFNIFECAFRRAASAHAAV